MNILEAVKSGRRIRRPGELWRNPHGKGLLDDLFSARDVVAEDWEVEPVKVTITAKQYWDAVAEAHKDAEQSRLFGAIYYRYDIPEMVAKKLGLGV